MEQPTPPILSPAVEHHPVTELSVATVEAWLKLANFTYYVMHKERIDANASTR